MTKIPRIVTYALRTLRSTVIRDTGTLSPDAATEVRRTADRWLTASPQDDIHARRRDSARRPA